MKKSRRCLAGVTGLAMLCVCSAVAAPLSINDADDGGSLMHDGIVIQAALESGDVETVRAFLQENTPDESPEANREETARQVRKIQDVAIETTHLEEVLENGNMEALRALLAVKST